MHAVLVKYKQSTPGCFKRLLFRCCSLSFSQSAIEPCLLDTMAFAPRSSKGPRRTLQYTGGAAPSHTPSKAKVSQSFDRSSISGFGESSVSQEDSTQSTCDSLPSYDTNCKASPPGSNLTMSWNSHNLIPGNIPSMIPGPLAAHVHTRSSHPPFTANNFGPSTSAQSNNTLFSTGMQDNMSFLTSELCTPAAKEGSRVEAKTPTSTPVNHRGQSAVVLTPATCKHLQDIAARLWVIAHNQQYEPQSMSDFDQKHGAMPQLGQAALLHVLELCSSTRVKKQSSRRLRCAMTLSLIIAAIACLFKMVFQQNRHPTVHFS